MDERLYPLFEFYPWEQELDHEMEAITAAIISGDAVLRQAVIDAAVASKEQRDMYQYRLDILDEIIRNTEEKS